MQGVGSGVTQGDLVGTTGRVRLPLAEMEKAWTEQEGRLPEDEESSVGRAEFKVPLRCSGGDGDLELGNHGGLSGERMVWLYKFGTESMWMVFRGVRLGKVTRGGSVEEAGAPKMGPCSSRAGGRTSRGGTVGVPRKSVEECLRRGSGPLLLQAVAVSACSPSLGTVSGPQEAVRCAYWDPHWPKGTPRMLVVFSRGKGGDMSSVCHLSRRVVCVCVCVRTKLTISIWAVLSLRASSRASRTSWCVTRGDSPPTPIFTLSELLPFDWHCVSWSFA